MDLRLFLAYMAKADEYGWKARASGAKLFIAQCKNGTRVAPNYDFFPRWEI